MPSHVRATGGDAHAAGRGRQRIKLRALGYNHARHGVDATVELAQAGLWLLCLAAIEFVDALPGALLKNRRVDLYRQGDSETLALAAIAYACARHGIDADVGMSREGLALLCQAAIDFVESLPREDSTTKRSSSPHFQIGNGANGANGT
jgi:hypothetical protein